MHICVMVKNIAVQHHMYLAVFIFLLLPLDSFAREIRVGIGFALPPYVIRETNSGLEVDLVRKSFELEGHKVEFVYLPNLRLPVAFAEGEVDCVVANAAYNLTLDSGRKAYPSNITISYQNYAITLPHSKMSIKTYDDLMQKRVLGFNNAVKYLGPEFADMAGKNLYYSELADQSLQVRMLYSGRVQVVISDKRIFFWWREKSKQSNLSKTLDLSIEPVFHSIFPPAPRRVHFGESDLRDSFNRGLSRFRESGAVEALFEKYIQE